ncbi:MAG: hypothetical protein ACI4HI_05275 [Lachnospiraceae bacterium]
MNKKTKKTIGLILIVVAMVWWMQDYMTTMNQTQVTLTANDVESYSYEATVEKKTTSYAIYKYKKQFVFVAKYTDGQGRKLETKVLDQEQQEAFIKEINEKAVVNVEESKGSDTKEATEKKSGVIANGEYHELQPIDMKKLGISVVAPKRLELSGDEAAVEEPSKDVHNQQAMELALEDEELPIALEPMDLEELIQQQFEKKVGTRLKKIRVSAQKENDFVIKATGFDNKSYQAICSYAGYVTEITE